MPFLPEVIGRDSLKQQLFQLQKDERIQVVLFYGAAGVGKHFVAKSFARSLLCMGEAVERRNGACGQCPSCRQWQGGGHPDFTDLQVEPKEKILKTERLREEVLADIHYTPRLATKRVFIIDADVLNEVGQNVLLKTLEEIPNYAYILLTVTHPEQLLVTVRSRCLPLYVGPINAEQLSAVLASRLGEEWKSTLTEDQFSWLHSVSAGSPGKGLQYLSSDAYEVSRIFLQQLEKAFEGRHQLAPLYHLSSVLQNKEWFDLYASLLLQFFTIISRVQMKNSDLQTDHQKTMQTSYWCSLIALGQQAVSRNKLAPLSVLKMIEYITEAKTALSLNVNYDLAVHRLLLKIGKEMTHA